MRNISVPSKGEKMQPLYFLGYNGCIFGFLMVYPNYGKCIEGDSLYGKRQEYGVTD